MLCKRRTALTLELIEKGTCIKHQSTSMDSICIGGNRTCNVTMTTMFFLYFQTRFLSVLTALKTSHLRHVIPQLQKYFCTSWPDIVSFKMTFTHLTVSKSWVRLISCWNSRCLGGRWPPQYAWINGQEESRGKERETSLYIPPCLIQDGLARLTLTSHDWMQWICWGAGYHFISPVQTMLWKSRHRETTVEQRHHNPYRTIALHMEDKITLKPPTRL